MPKFTAQYLKLPHDPGVNMFEAARKSHDVAKGEIVQWIGVNAKGDVAVLKADRTQSEHWHSMDAFYPTASNDNATQE